jgi:acyl dehydratase
MRDIDGIAGLARVEGETLGSSEWTPITQELIQSFADLTGDRQWIHVDQERAARGPYRGTIAHGFLVLAMVPAMAAQVYRVNGLAMVVNYGLEKVRFPAAAPAGSRIRVDVRVISVRATERGHLALIKHTVECEGSARPVCVAEQLRLLIEEDR